MSETTQENDTQKEAVRKRWRPGEMRSLNGDERISFSVVALYLFIFCSCTYLFWSSLSLKIVGGTAALLGFMLFINAVLNKGTLPRKHSRYTIKWYLTSFFCGLVVLISLRYVANSIDNHSLATGIIMGSILLLFVIFKKTIIQLLMAFIALVFIYVLASNWNQVVAGEVGFVDAVRKSGRTIFRIQPIEDVANTLIAGNYATYLNKVDYRDEQINMLSVKKVLTAGDDDLRKTKIILDFVSNHIMYVSDPDDGYEYAKDPLSTLISSGGDCEDQSVLICSMLESVGVKTYLGFTGDHVFALVSFKSNYQELAGTPYLLIENKRCYIIDPADAGAVIGYGAAQLNDIEHIFDVRTKALERFTIPPTE